MLKRFADWIIARAERRGPDFQIGGAADPYLNRWWLIPRNPFFNIYLHQFIRSDEDRALHDHPWMSLSLMLRGHMTEITSPDWMPLASRWIRAGDWVYRPPRFSHRLVVAEEQSGKAWTLFITGPRLRAWGFWCRQGWVHWEKFTAGPNGQLVGRGCGEHD